MDLITTRAMDITKLAMDGLAARHKAITANIANAEVSGYTRSDVVFEDQLSEIINSKNEEDQNKLVNSYPNVYQTSDSIFNDEFSSNSAAGMMNAKKSYSDFVPQIIADEESPVNEIGNSVNIEKEMVELSKNGSKYSVLAELESRNSRGMLDIIKGGI